MGDLPTAEQLFGRLEEWQLRPDAGQPEELGERASDIATCHSKRGEVTVNMTLLGYLWDSLQGSSTSVGMF